MKILCIIPVFNGEGVVDKAINSIIKQSYTNWELVIVDDASTDKTSEILAHYSKHPKITVLTNKTNQGAFYSRNRALYHMQDKNWDIFTVHDADDTSTSDRFFIYTQILKENPTLEVIVGSSQGKRWEWHNDTPKIKYKNHEYASGINFYSRLVFDKMGYFYPTRFAGDAEYIEKFLIYLLGFVPEGMDFETYKNKIVRALDPQYSYTYTTGFHSSTPSLTKQHNKKDRDEFKHRYKLQHSYYNSESKYWRPFFPNLEDRNLHPRDIKPNILVATPMWGRFDLTKKFIKHHQDLGLDVLVVGSEGENSRKVCEDLGCYYIEHANNPIGAKFNKRVDFFLENKQYTHLLLLGSDDFISESALNTIKYHLKYVDVINWSDIYFYSPEHNKLVYSVGYDKDHYRYGEPLAPGRCLSREVIENTLKGELWPSDRDRAPDGPLWERLKQYKNQIILSCKSTNNIIVDIKTDNNITSFNKLMTNTWKMGKYVDASHLIPTIKSWIQ